MEMRIDANIYYKKNGRRHVIKSDKEKVNKLNPEVIVILPRTKIHDILNNVSNLLNLKNLEYVMSSSKVAESQFLMRILDKLLKIVSINNY